MSFKKKPAAPAVSLKQSSAYGKLPSDAIVGLDRRDLPPSLRRGTSGLSSSGNQGGRSVPSYMQGTQTSQRRDIGLNVRRLAKAPSKTEEEVMVKGYGAPTRLPSLYEQSQINPKPVPGAEASQAQPAAAPQQGTTPYVPLQVAKAREATDKEVQQISKTCRYVRRKGSLVDPPSFYYKR